MEIWRAIQQLYTEMSDGGGGVSPIRPLCTCDSHRHYVHLSRSMAPFRSPGTFKYLCPSSPARLWQMQTSRKGLRWKDKEQEVGRSQRDSLPASKGVCSSKEGSRCRPTFRSQEFHYCRPPLLLHRRRLFLIPPLSVNVKDQGALYLISP